MADYTRWYRAGTVSVTSDGKNVTGTETYWLSAGLHPGDLFTADNGLSFYEIDAITDNTHLTLKTAYKGVTDKSSPYGIVRNFTATTGAEVAAQASALLSDFRQYIDTDMQSIHGKSAYDIAKLHGYTGSESAWLESLKAAGEWTKLDARTSFLTELTGPGIHNSVFRGKNLGSKVTDAQYQEIKNGTFGGMYIGDYWEIGGVKHRIAHFDYFYYRNCGVVSSVWGEDAPKAKSWTWYPHHVIILPDSEIISGVWHTDDTVNHVYYQSNFWNEVIPELCTKLAGWFGNEHLLEWCQTVPNLISDDHASVSWANPYVMACLLGCSELFGFPCTRGNGNLWQNVWNTYQFALFRLMPYYMTARLHTTVLRDFEAWRSGCAVPNILWRYGQIVANGQQTTWFRSSRGYRPWYGLAVYE